MHLKSESEVAQSCLTLCDPWTVAYQVPSSMGFSRQECWSGLPFPSPRDLPDPGIEPRSPAFQADALPSEPPGKPYSPTQHKWKKNPPPPSRQRAWARLLCRLLTAKSGDYGTLRLGGPGPGTASLGLSFLFVTCYVATLTMR